MHQQRETLDIIFRRTVPETILQKIRSGDTLIPGNSIHDIAYDRYTSETYDHYSLLNLPEYTPTEVRMRAEALSETISGKTGGIYSLLYLYADEVLRYDGDCLTCRLEETLNWHSIYLKCYNKVVTGVANKI